MKYIRTIELEIDDELLNAFNENYYENTDENISSLEDLEAYLDEFSDNELMFEFENSHQRAYLAEIDEKMLDRMQKIC